MSAKSATKVESQAAAPIPVLHATSAPPLPASYLGSATRDCSHPPPHPRDTDKQRLDAGARVHPSQSHVVRHELRPLHASMSKPTPMRRQSRLACAAAAVAAVIFACSAVGAVAASYSLGTWSTAALSAARGNLAATSLPNLGVAIFAGGGSTCCWFCLSCCMMRCFVRGVHELQECDLICECLCLTPCAAGSVPFDVVDILNVTAGTWSTAALSAARGNLAATSLPNLGVAIFAGGGSTCCWFCFELLHDAFAL